VIGQPIHALDGSLAALKRPFRNHDARARREGALFRFCH
jgi:hypothetical protein